MEFEHSVTGQHKFRLTALVGGEPAGYVEYVLLPFDRMLVLGLFVEENHRNAGVGEALSDRVYDLHDGLDDPGYEVGVESLSQDRLRIGPHYTTSMTPAGRSVINNAFDVKNVRESRSKPFSERKKDRKRGGS